MLRTITHSDGSQTEIRQTGGEHPEQTSGMRTNVTRVWARANGGAWHSVGERSLQKAIAKIEAAGSATEALASIDASAFDAVDSMVSQ